MRLTQMIFLAALMCTGAAYAQSGTASCESKAVDKNGKVLSGAAKGSFMKKCEADVKMAAPNCADKASDKKLAGAAKTSFMKKCEADAGMPAAALCDAKAVDKNGKPLAGAAKTSSVKKCEAEMAGK